MRPFVLADSLPRTLDCDVKIAPRPFCELMTFNARTTTALAVLIAVLTVSVSAAALRVPKPPTYEGRNDPNTKGGERVGEDEDFDGYPADAGKPGDLYYDPSVEYRAYSPEWTGASWGFGLQGGLGRLYGPVFDKTQSGMLLGGFVQASTVLGVADVIASVTRGGFDSAIGGQDVDVTRWDISLSATIHPGLFFNLSGGRFWHTMAQLYLMGGGNLTVQDVRGGAINSHFVRPGFHIGGGIDTYLDTPHNGSAFWLGVQYKWTNTAGGLHDDLFRYNWTREHQILLRLSFRINGNLLKGLPGPSPR